MLCFLFLRFVVCLLNPACMRSEGYPCVCVCGGGGGCVWVGRWVGEWVNGWVGVCVCMFVRSFLPIHACI